MILISLGTQLPFSRYLEAVFNVAVKVPFFQGQKIVVQMVGGGNFGIYRDMAGFYDLDVDFYEYLSADDYEVIFDRCDLVFSHAGMGGIIKCLERGKKLVVFPRRKVFGEHRNDHQLDTAKVFESGYQNIKVLFDEREIDGFFLSSAFSDFLDSEADGDSQVSTWKINRDNFSRNLCELLLRVGRGGNL
ncbi:glycosyltransferase [Microbulbifer sp. ARAS458-1]|uniref:glycosyltransferase n=1 Tax=Microbulbifer sp. ARAS458-1 TaxID=3140242 RepID=UPI003877C128